MQNKFRNQCFPYMTLCLKALIYIITYFIGGHNEWSWPNNKYSHTDIYVYLINSLGGKTFRFQNDTKGRRWKKWCQRHDGRMRSTFVLLAGNYRTGVNICSEEQRCWLSWERRRVGGGLVLDSPAVSESRVSQTAPVYTFCSSVITHSSQPYSHASDNNL